MWQVSDNGVTGILSDFDLARSGKAIRQDESKVVGRLQAIRCGAALPPLTFKGQVVGTSQFIATELLATHYVPVQTYKHDLESLFWLLVVHCGTHDLRRSRYNDANFEDWYNPDWKAIGGLKSDFLTADDSRDIRELFNRYFRSAHEEYRDLIENWIRPLRLLFRSSGNNFYAGCRSDCLGEFAKQRTNIFDDFMEIIGQPYDNQEDDSDAADDEYVESDGYFSEEY